MTLKNIKSALFAALFLMSISCFMYVNSHTLEPMLPLNTVVQSPTLEDETVKGSSKMPDLTFVKNVLTVIQKFLPAK